MKMLILGFFTPWIAYAGITLLHCVLPARKIKGYVKHDTTGEVLNYRINGILVLPASILVWFLLGYFEIVPFDWLYQVRWASLVGAVVIGLLFSFIIVLKAPSTGKSFLADFWFGRIKNPQFKNGFIDSKMWLYLIGAVMLQLNVLSFAVYHWQNVEALNPGLFLGAAMATWFCWDYLIFERVHLYTYDLFAERTGFKLGFGCLTFYPYFYAVSLWCTVRLPNPGLPLWLSGVFILVFLLGWFMTRGANLQKFFFKIAPDKKFICIKPEAISDGNRSLLVSGFWGASRHINYLGEIVQACGIALAAGYPAVLGVWLYPLYYVGLLFTRQVDDDKICKAKYGELWDTYTKKVKYRIIPFIY
jgi:delta14-sterol reductase